MRSHDCLLGVAHDEGAEYTAEREPDYIVQVLDALDRTGSVGMSPTREATQDWAAEVSDGIVGTVWDDRCDSWYMGDGKLPVIWPYDRDRWFATIAAPDLDHFETIGSKQLLAGSER